MEQMPSSPSVANGPTNALLDSSSCGEDLLHNANRMAELAPLHCVDCADYHIRRSVQRASGVPLSIVHDRARIISLITGFLAALPPEGRNLVNIVIPGSADTGILATCAHAAAISGPAMLSRCKFTVVDRCRTPLMLCREFAGRYAIKLETCEGDISDPALSFTADLVVVHSLFRFIEPAGQVNLLKTFGNWLSPGGRIIFSIAIRGGGAADIQTDIRKHEFVNRLVGQMVTENQLNIRESRHDFAARLTRSMRSGFARPGELRSPEEAGILFEKAGLTALSDELIIQKIELDAGHAIERHRLLAVLGVTVPADKSKANQGIGPGRANERIKNPPRVS